ncbi:MAG: DUF2608 domain-containing protein [Alphaproteobacteria bacterium]|nr:DUF2608 domain-containing protein [Alphaproteobacteria bacterium]OJV47132.1 MAG: hypothetical protein BGO28_01670 [Alphaproteobacteria bacterium 43-37]
MYLKKTCFVIILSAILSLASVQSIVAVAHGAVDAAVSFVHERETLVGLEELVRGHNVTLLDIDDVVLTTHHYGCGTHWTRGFIKTLRSKPVTEALLQLHDMYRCYVLSTHKAVDPEGLIGLNKAAKDYMVFGFSARLYTMAEATSREVMRAGMQFSQVPFEANVLLGGVPVMHQGIIYTGGYHVQVDLPDKGEVFASLMKDGVFGRDVSKVLYVDDSLRHHVEMSKACEMLGIQCTHIHLTTIVKQIERRKISPEALEYIGNAQFKAIVANQNPPTDEEALEQYENLAFMNQRARE